MITPLSRKHVITNIIMLISATSIGQLAIGLSLLFTARPLGIDSFGQYSACFALTKMTSILFTLGTDTWLLREGRRGEIPLGKLIGSNFTIKTLVGFIWLIGLFIASRFLDPKTYPPELLFWSALATWLEASLLTVSYGFIISLRNKATAVLGLTSSLGLLFGTLGLAFLHQNEPMAYVWVRLSVAGLATLGGLFWFRKISPLSSDLRVIRLTTKNILPFALSDALVLIYAQADITIVALTLGQQAAGLYSPASGILRAMFVIPSAVYLVMTPVIGQLVAERSQRLSRTIRQTYLFLAGIGALLWMFASLMGPWISRLILGPKFSVSGALLVILGVILFIRSCSYASTAVIVATTGQGRRVVIQALAAAINVTLNLLVIHRYGITGVAWVYVISELVLMAGYLIIAERGRLKVTTSKGQNYSDVEESGLELDESRKLF
jgi:O-antigen/teichoic acid export membrane protein